MPHCSKAWTITSVSEWSVRQRVPAERLELGADLGVVVDLAVEDELDRAVLVRHRLHRRVGEVDDRQPAEAEADAAVVVDPGAAAVGAAVDHRARASS